MRHAKIFIATAFLLVPSCNQVDVGQILIDVANQLTAPAGASGDPSVLRLSNVSPQSMSGTLEVFYTLDDGTTSRQTAFLDVQPDFAATFDVGCPSSIRFSGTFGTLPFDLTVQRDVDYACGRLLEFAAGPATVVQFFNSSL